MMKDYFVYNNTKYRQSQTLDAEQRHNQRCVKLKENQTESVWVRCPFCGGKTRIKIYEDTVLIKFPLFCPKCKKEVRIDVVQLKMVLSK